LHFCCNDTYLFIYSRENIGLSITCHFINLDKDGAKQGLSIGVSAPNQEFQAVDHLAHSGA